MSRLKITVLGAYGAVGRHLAMEAQDMGYVVTAVGRDPDRLARVPADDHVQLGVPDTDGLFRLAETQDVVVNATGVEDPSLASTATAGGAAFLDISAEGAYLRQLERITHPPRPIVAGTGLAPGLTNLLAASVPGDGPLHIGLVSGAGERHGDAGRNWIWESAGRVVTSGGTRQRVYRHARRFTVPGLGSRTLLRAAFGEQDQLVAQLNRPVSSWLGLDPPWATLALALAGTAPTAAAHLDRLNAPVTKRLGSYQRWHIVVTDETQTLAWAGGQREVDATAAIAALCLQALVEAEPRVYAAHNLITLDAIRGALASLGITVEHAPPSAAQRSNSEPNLAEPRKAMRHALPAANQHRRGRRRVSRFRL